MFTDRAVGRTIQERIRCGFGRLSQAVVHTEYGSEHDDPFTPIIISQNSELTVCSGITMDEALTGQAMDDHYQVCEDAQSYNTNHCNSDSYAAALIHKATTMRQNIQGATSEGVQIGHDIYDAKLAEEATQRVHCTETESTAESDEEDDDDDCLGLWPTASGGGKDATAPPVKSTHSTLNVCVKLEDFDFDHLTIYQDSVFANDPSENSEAWITKKLERNAAELYWLQLTTELLDPKRLILAMQGNTAVRNVTVYPCALQGLSQSDQKLLVDSICRLENLQNLIVFQDCGSFFVDPLIRHRPPLTRLTLYKLDFAREMLLSRLPILLLGLPELAELSLEKYRGAEGDKLLQIVSKVLPSLPHLRNLSLTPAKGVNMSTDGPRVLFKALCENNSVRTLSLQGSEESIDQGCINVLRRSLRTNSTLEEIKLTGFWKSEEDFWKRFTPKSRIQIQYFLELNKSGIRSLQLDINADFETLTDAMTRHRDNLNFVYYLLLHNPSMVNRRKIPEISYEPDEISVE